MNKAEEYLKENDFTPNNHGVYLADNGDDTFNLSKILEDYANQQVKEAVKPLIQALSDIIGLYHECDRSHLSLLEEASEIASGAIQKAKEVSNG